MNNKIRNRKGFTLAELLIVVAIIAVLTAIAVPLFVNALNTADDATKEANMRAIRGEAVSTILLSDEGDAKIRTNGELKGPWYVYAEVTKNGQITTMDIDLKDTHTYAADKCEKSGDKYVVTLKITIDQVNKT